MNIQHKWIKDGSSLFNFSLFNFGAFLLVKKYIFFKEKQPHAFNEWSHPFLIMGRETKHDQNEN